MKIKPYGCIVKPSTKQTVNSLLPLRTPLPLALSVYLSEATGFWGVKENDLRIAQTNSVRAPFTELSSNFLFFKANKSGKRLHFKKITVFAYLYSQNNTG